MTSPSDDPRVHASTLPPSDVHNLLLAYIKQDASQSTDITNLKVTVNKDVPRKLGSFTDVYQGEVLTNGTGIVAPTVVAIKRVRYDPNPKNTEMVQKIISALRGEEERWPSLSHPNLCPLWRLSSQTEAIPVVGMPWFANGNVLDFTRQNPAVDKLALVLQVAGALKYIHAIGIVHGNVVPANIMIADDGSAMLADVCLNACLSKAMYNGAWPVPSRWMLKAPEELQYECDPTSFVHTMAMDVCAFGNTIHTIYTPKPPYSAQLYKGIVEIMSREHVIERPGEITEPLWDLLQLCRSYLPGDRPSMVAVEEFLVQM